MRLFCDENIRDTTVAWLRGLGHDVTTAKDVGLAGAPDDEVLFHSISDKRVLLTFNVDFVDLRELAAIHHSGIIRLRFKLQAEEVVHPVLAEVLEQLQGQETTDILFTVHRDRLRWRKTHE